MRKIDAVVFHSTDTESGSMEELREHYLSQGKKDTGFHLVVFPDGSVFKDRAENEIGSHCSGVNNRSLGIALVGKFSEGFIPEEQLNSAAKEIATWILKYNIPIERVTAHKEVADVECPNFRPEDLRSKVWFSSRELKNNGHRRLP